MDTQRIPLGSLGLGHNRTPRRTTAPVASHKLVPSRVALLSENMGNGGAMARRKPARKRAALGPTKRSSSAPRVQSQPQVDPRPPTTVPHDDAPKPGSGAPVDGPHNGASSSSSSSSPIPVRPILHTERESMRVLTEAANAAQAWERQAKQDRQAYTAATAVAQSFQARLQEQQALVDQLRSESAELNQQIRTLRFANELALQHVESVTQYYDGCLRDTQHRIQELQSRVRNQDRIDHVLGSRSASSAMESRVQELTHQLQQAMQALEAVTQQRDEALEQLDASSESVSSDDDDEADNSTSGEYESCDEDCTIRGKQDVRVDPSHSDEDETDAEDAVNWADICATFNPIPGPEVDHAVPFSMLQGANKALTAEATQCGSGDDDAWDALFRSAADSVLRWERDCVRSWSACKPMQASLTHSEGDEVDDVMGSPHAHAPHQQEAAAATRNHLHQWYEMHPIHIGECTTSEHPAVVGHDSVLCAASSSSSSPFVDVCLDSDDDEGGVVDDDDDASGCDIALASPVSRKSFNGDHIDDDDPNAMDGEKDTCTHQQRDEFDEVVDDPLQHRDSLSTDVSVPLLSALSHVGDSADADGASSTASPSHSDDERLPMGCEGGSEEDDDGMHSSGYEVPIDAFYSSSGEEAVDAYDEVCERTSDDFAEEEDYYDEAGEEMHSSPSGAYFVTVGRGRGSSSGDADGHDSMDDLLGLQ